VPLSSSVEVLQWWRRQQLLLSPSSLCLKRKRWQ
jgi:hypothetical protein